MMDLSTAKKITGEIIMSKEANKCAFACMVVSRALDLSSCQVRHDHTGAATATPLWIAACQDYQAQKELKRVKKDIDTLPSVIIS